MLEVQNVGSIYHALVLDFSLMISTLSISFDEWDERPSAILSEIDLLIQVVFKHGARAICIPPRALLGNLRGRRLWRSRLMILIYDGELVILLFSHADTAVLLLFNLLAHHIDLIKLDLLLLQLLLLLHHLGRFCSFFLAVLFLQIMLIFIRRDGNCHSTILTNCSRWLWLLSRLQLLLLILLLELYLRHLVRRLLLLNRLWRWLLVSNGRLDGFDGVRHGLRTLMTADLIGLKGRILNANLFLLLVIIYSTVLLLMNSILVLLMTKLFLMLLDFLNFIHHHLLQIILLWLELDARRWRITVVVLNDYMHVNTSIRCRILLLKSMVASRGYLNTRSPSSRCILALNCNALLLRNCFNHVSIWVSIAVRTWLHIFTTLFHSDGYLGRVGNCCGIFSFDHRLLYFNLRLLVTIIIFLSFFFLLFLNRLLIFWLRYSLLSGLFALPAIALFCCCLFIIITFIAVTLFVLPGAVFFAVLLWVHYDFTRADAWRFWFSAWTMR